jgi:predicted RNA-binding Zn ribbon-like protein
VRTLPLITGAVQPGGRAPAPEPLALVQAFLNTTIRSEPGADLLDKPGEWATWLTTHRMEPDPFRREVEGLRRLREALHRLLRDPGEPLAVATLEINAERVGLRPRFDPPRLEAPEGDLAGHVLAAVFAAMADGTWRRLKACPGRHCGWVFYDRSANASATWCSMRVCGQREKARAYYRRRVNG